MRVQTRYGSLPAYLSFPHLSPSIMHSSSLLLPPSLPSPPCALPHLPPKAFVTLPGTRPGIVFVPVCVGNVAWRVTECSESESLKVMKL